MKEIKFPISDKSLYISKKNGRLQNIFKNSDIWTFGP